MTATAGPFLRKRKRPLFGVPCVLFAFRRRWWWRAEIWAARRGSVGPYLTREEAVRDAARLLYCKPELRTARE